MISIANKQDGLSIIAITDKVSIFTHEEKTCVSELWNEYCKDGSQNTGYNFVVECEDAHIRGYACFGPRSLTLGAYDLYWIAVDPQYQRAGVGRMLLDYVEKAVRQMGGRLLIAETSGLEDYTPTRQFYISTGYNLEATIKNFYNEGDDLIIFTKHL